VGAYFCAHYLLFSGGYPSLSSVWCWENIYWTFSCGEDWTSLLGRFFLGTGMEEFVNLSILYLCLSLCITSSWDPLPFGPCIIFLVTHFINPLMYRETLIKFNIPLSSMLGVSNWRLTKLPVNSITPRQVQIGESYCLSIMFRNQLFDDPQKHMRMGRHQIQRLFLLDSSIHCHLCTVCTSCIIRGF